MQDTRVGASLQAPQCPQPSFYSRPPCLVWNGIFVYIPLTASYSEHCVFSAHLYAFFGDVYLALLTTLKTEWLTLQFFLYTLETNPLSDTACTFFSHPVCQLFNFLWSLAGQTFLVFINPNCSFLFGCIASLKTAKTYTVVLSKHWRCLSFIFLLVTCLKVICVYETKKSPNFDFACGAF